MTRFLLDDKEYIHIFYVYTLAYPDGTVFYVGKGQGERINGSADRKLNKNHNWDKLNVITAIEYQGHRVSKRIIATFELEQHALVYESMLMESYGLTNLTNIHYSTNHRTFRKPHPIQTVDAEISPKGKLINILTFERTTNSPWPDDE